MNRSAKQVMIIIGGYFFLILGVIGAILPIMQGWFFFLIGLVMLSKTTPWARRWLHKLRLRFPKLASKADKLVSKWRRN
ncbi:PGPGW domain-containing protein [Shimazuella sp. AN120528]|uniref:PGPGW domain-containing protein n=1 Tax=Shimazuella soli TaxID=1892854 RepID=UPI001F10F723|nr:PGPGW domain-containing protein [Shimazuella soli]MCH5583905.1 PGPGW domain-containing protein [Shimazuella soli]